nr:RNB domain-containing ribonuclease [Natronoglycomyces albus]
MPGLDHTSGIMIDSAETVDRDDAIWVIATETGFEFWVHIARVADHLVRGSSADAEARRRMHTLYRRTYTKHMLPRPVEAQASLRACRKPSESPAASETSITTAADETQDTFTVHCRTDVAGNILDVELGRGILDRAWTMTYAEAAEAATNPEATCHQQLATASDLAQRLLQRRRYSGALAIYDLQRGYATNEEGQLIRLADDTRNSGYVIVQELMIAANAAIASWAAERDIPILFRNHRLAAVAGDPRDLQEQLLAAETSGDIQEWELLRNRMRMVARAATYGPSVSGHHGLQLPVYAHNTSPLRRYPDLINQRILLAVTSGHDSPYDLEELRELAEDLNERLAEERQRKSEHFRKAAERVTARQLSQADYEQLDEADFARVVRAAVETDTTHPDLLKTIEQRVNSGQLQLRELGAVYFDAVSPAWLPLRQLIGQHLAADPSRAVSLVNMYAQAVLGGPLDASHVTWSVHTGGDIHEPRFSARLTLELGEEHHTGPARTARSKREARNLAALALAAQLAGLGETEPDDELPSVPTNVQNHRALEAAVHPIQAVTIYEQRGLIADLNWEYELDGPPHEREFTCRATAKFNGVKNSAVMSELASDGTGATKKAAKAAAAAQLRAQIERHSNLLAD